MRAGESDDDDDENENENEQASDSDFDDEARAKLVDSLSTLDSKSKRQKFEEDEEDEFDPENDPSNFFEESEANLVNNGLCLFFFFFCSISFVCN